MVDGIWIDEAEGRSAVLFACTVRAELKEYLHREGENGVAHAMLSAVIWDDSSRGYAGKNVLESAIDKAVGNICTKFANAYLKQNTANEGKK